MITAEDLNPKDFLTTSIQGQNLDTLASLLTILEAEFRKTPESFIFKVTSGFRSMADHYRIYKVKGIDHPPLGSKHLTGQAADILDTKHILQAWLGTEECPNETLVKCNLYCEAFAATPGWVHFQDSRPKSGHRFFKP